MSDKKFELVDRATERKAQLPVRNGTIGPSVVDISAIHKDLGVFTFDPGFGLTAATESRITYIDGDAGTLLYRGFPIEQLAGYKVGDAFQAGQAAPAYGAAPAYPAYPQS